MTAIGSPDFTAPPSWTASSAIVPALWAKISFSIFIASMMQTSAPSSTSAPCSTSTFQTLPCSGEASVSPPPPPPAAALALALGRGARRRWRPRRGAAASASPRTTTSKRLPETSTV